MARTSKRYIRKNEEQAQKVFYKAGVYTRLSSERKEEWREKSSSIETQVLCCKEYALKENIKVVNIYTDYEYSGTNFERPQFQEMMQDIRERRINCIIIRDLSRLGREYLEMGRLIDKVFPFLGVRFISVNDKVDTVKDLDSKKSFEVTLKNIINDMYAKDISVKIKTSKHNRARNGYFIGSVPPYGYKVVKLKEGQKLEVDEKEFAELFGELLKAENILKNFDEFEDFEKIISDRQIQDMKSVYVDIRESIVSSKHNENLEGNQVDFSDIEFQIDLLKTDEINLDYILALILEKSKENDDVESLKAEVCRVIRSSLGTRAKEELIMEFINSTRLSDFKNTDDTLESFYKFARKEKEIKIKELLEEEKLKEDSKRFIEKAISKGYVEYAGDELDRIIPPTSRRQGAREKKKESVLEKIRKIVDVFVGI